ncbi:hypothetical protein FJZ39_00900 [Candidatus Saccharibacteria bacterium]|nr:hypothetical protein [Candidatus Saccharibacteria bacterium]
MVHDPHLDGHTDEYAPENNDQRNHESAPFSEHVLATLALHELVQGENDHGTGMVGGMSNAQLIGLLRRMVDALSK